MTRAVLLSLSLAALGPAALAEEASLAPDPKGPPSRLKVRFAPAFLSFLSAVWGDYWVIEPAAPAP
jgi:apolipoprotein D and lipocalin family protein